MKHLVLLVFFSMILSSSSFAVEKETECLAMSESNSRQVVDKEAAKKKNKTKSAAGSSARSM